MDGTSARLGLPLLTTGQAQKEITHNEALALIDLALQPSVLAMDVDVPPSAPTPGETWIVGPAPVGEWVGHAKALAGWTDGGWRFVAASEGMVVWTIADAAPARYIDGEWAILGPAPAIAAPSGGTTIDVEARTVLTSVLAALRAHRLVAG